METMIREYKENIHLLKKVLQTTETEVEQQEIRSMINDLNYSVIAIKRASKAPRVSNSIRTKPVEKRSAAGTREEVPHIEVSIPRKRRAIRKQKQNVLTLNQFLRIPAARISTFKTHGVEQDYLIDKQATHTDPMFVGRAIRLDTRESISLVKLYYQLRNVRTLDNKMVLAKRIKPNDILWKIQIPVKARRNRRT
ncbi:hypothetical protein [Listeria seeligeri]|uniref:hypothetical protein n=1 Tax=Listeria seeligeri TaxID=1640 RepID=UPI0010DA87A1|nr:hypothetical protein [Listeria seeligeri]